MENPSLETAIRLLGGPGATARLAKVSAQALQVWRQVGRITHAPALVRIHYVSGAPLVKLAGLTEAEVRLLRQQRTELDAALAEAGAGDDLEDDAS